jgi:hypothetical protein
VTGETRRRAPGSGTGERLADVGLRLSQVAAPDEHLCAEDLHGGRREDRPAPVCLGQQVVVHGQRLVEVRHREHGARRKERRRGIRTDERSRRARDARSDGVRGTAAARASW